MKFYNYFSERNELSRYVEGKFSGKGIYFDPSEFQKKETLRSKLKLFSKSGKMKFSLKAKNSRPIQFVSNVENILNIKEDICDFFSNRNFSIQIQAMTTNKIHIHISEKINGITNIHFSGILNKKKFLFF